MTPKERLYAIIAGQSHDRPAVTPIFMAWSADYIGKTYRDYYLDGDVLVRSQLAVTRDFNLDQISAISDPWREASAYGMEFEYPPDGLGKPKSLLLKSPEDFSLVRPLDLMAAERTKQRIESVAKLAAAVGQTHSVLGWVEGPLAEYSDLRGVETALMDLIDKPDVYVTTAKTIVDNAIAFAQAQIEAGADMIGIGDAAASLIAPGMYREFVLPFETRLIDAIHNAGAAVKLHICGNITNNLPEIAKTGADVIDLDWMVPVRQARETVGPEITLAGNFDPTAVLLQGTAQDVAEAARKCLDAGGDRFILQPGCEVPPATPEENIRAFCPGEGCLIPDKLGR